MREKRNHQQICMLEELKSSASKIPKENIFEPTMVHVAKLLVNYE